MHVFFKISTLSALLMAGFAYADTSSVATQQLPTVEVKGKRIPSTRTITTKKLDETTDTQLKEVLAKEPSISFGGGNGTSQFLYIRGMGQNSIDVKLDNAYSDSQIHYHQGRHMLDPALVKIVSVQKGAGSASAGIGQTNGAIIAKTLDASDLLKNSSNQNFGAKINAGYNSNDGHNYGLSVFGKQGMFDYLIAGNRSNESAYKGGKGYVNTMDGSREVPYSALDKISYLAKLGATVGDHRFVLSHLHEQHKGTRLVREEFGVDNSAGSRLTSARQAPAERKMYVDKTDLTWTGQNLGFAQTAEANVYYMTHGRWSADDSGNGYAGGSTLNAKGEATKNKVQTLGANVNFDSQVHDKVLLKYGLNYRDQTIKPHQLAKSGVVNQSKQDVGIYIEAISDITDKLTLTTGLRYDHFDFKAMDGRKRKDGAINPSISAIYQVTPELSVNALHNYATRSPRMHDALMSHGGGSLVTIDPSTKAEQARNTEIGFKYDKGTFGVEGAYFWQNIKDALGTTNGRDNHGNTAQAIINAGKIKNHGYELSGFYRYNGLTARLGVAHSKPRFHAQTRWQTNSRTGALEEVSLLSGNPEYASAIGRTWTASLSYLFKQPRVEVGIHQRFVEKVKPEDNYFIQGGTLKTGSDNGKAGYGITDVTANWKPFKNDRMNVNFAVNNVFNKLYIPHAQRSNLAGEGRQFRVGVNYTF